MPVLDCQEGLTSSKIHLIPVFNALHNLLDLYFPISDNTLYSILSCTAKYRLHCSSFITNLTGTFFKAVTSLIILQNLQQQREYFLFQLIVTDIMNYHLCIIFSSAASQQLQIKGYHITDCLIPAPGILGKSVLTTRHLQKALDAEKIPTLFFPVIMRRLSIIICYFQLKGFSPDMQLHPAVTKTPEEKCSHTGSLYRNYRNELNPPLTILVLFPNTSY